MPLDSRAFRDALGCFATGVTVITTLDPKGRPVGFTASSFNSVSLEPPLVLFSLGRRAHSLRAFLSSHDFAVNVLAADQQWLSDLFGKQATDRWSGLDFETWDSGCPILPGAVANFECHTRYTHDGGDHVIFVGEVSAMAYDDQRRPLVFHQGRYRDLP